MKDFVPYQEALALRELGFDEPCFGYFHPIHNELLLSSMFRSCYPNNAPTYSQAFRFFREKYGLDCSFEDGMVEDENGNEIQMWEFFIYKTKQKSDDKKMTFCSNNSNTFIESFSREEAELACLKKLIEIVKSKEE